MEGRHTGELPTTGRNPLKLIAILPARKLPCVNNHDAIRAVIASRAPTGIAIVRVVAVAASACENTISAIATGHRRQYAAPCVRGLQKHAVGHLPFQRRLHAIEVREAICFNARYATRSKPLVGHASLEVSGRYCIRRNAVDRVSRTGQKRSVQRARLRKTRSARSYIAHFEH